MRKLEWTLVVSLLSVCAGFPLYQALHEMIVDKEAPHLVNLFRAAPTKENLHRWDSNAKDRSVFAKWLRPATLQLRFDLLGEMAPKSLMGRDGWLFYNEDVGYLLQPPYTDDRFYKGTFDTLIAGKRVNLRNPVVAMTDFRDRLRERGIELLLVPIPGKPSIYPEMLVKGFRGHPASPTVALLDDLRGRGFQVADLFTPMLAAKAGGAGPLYLKRDTHWTPEGVEVAADVLSARIRDLLPAEHAPRAPEPRIVAASGPSGLEAKGGPATMDSAAASPASASPARYALRDTVVERWGDVAEMTKVPERKSIWAAEPVTSKRVMDSQSGAPYRDSAESDILWLGDSFSRIYQTDAPGAAGIIAHVAYRLNRPLASIVNDGGASTVVRQQLARRDGLLDGKRLVIWTFVERDLRFGSKGWQVEPLP